MKVLDYVSLRLFTRLLTWFSYSIILHKMHSTLVGSGCFLTDTEVAYIRKMKRVAHYQEL
jgi:hypothetical protein